MISTEDRREAFALREFGNICRVAAVLFADDVGEELRVRVVGQPLDPRLYPQELIGTPSR